MTTINKGERHVQVIAHVLMILLAVLALAPFLLMVSGSLTSDNALIKTGYRFLPSEFSLASYQYLFGESAQIGRAYLITIIVTVSGTVLSVLISSMAAFALGQRQVPGLKFVFVLFLIPMLFSGGIVASYINYTNIFHIKDTLLAYIVPNYLVSVFNIILIRNYISSSLPDSLTEAAEIDGAGRIQTFFHITIPMVSPTLFFVVLMRAMSSLKQFDTIYLLINTRNPAYKSATVLMTLFYREAFEKFNKGYGSAIVLYTFVIIAIFTAIQFITEKKLVHYD